MTNIEDNEIVIGNKKVFAGHFHGLINNGGSIKFNNLPFGIRIRGIGGPFVNLELFTVPNGVEYKGQINPTVKKTVKKVERIETEEDEAIVM